MPTWLKQTANGILLALIIPTTLYLTALTLLIAFPSLQPYAIYLHKVTLTGSKDLNVPEQFGFLHNQVTPFHVSTADGVKLHGWHVLPLGAYQAHEQALLQQQDLRGPVEDVTATLNFRLLRGDPEARLVIYFHGTSGTIGSTVRPDSYRNLYAAAPEKVHVLSFDYGGYGLSDGAPSERGLLLDALATVNWATEVARIPPDRIILYGQSLGSAVAVTVAEHLALQERPVSLAGLVISASFSDLATLTGTYRIGGVIPVLSPIAKVPALFHFVTSRLQDTWLVKDKLASLVRASEHYHITLIHSENDPDIPCMHTQQLFWYAVNASQSSGMSFDDLESEKKQMTMDIGPGGWVVDWRTSKGLIRQEMLKYGVHDLQMTFPVTALAVLRTFQSSDPEFGTTPR